MPKYRRKILNPGMSGYLRRILPKILKEMHGIEVIELNVQVDHIYAVMIIPPRYSVSDVIGRTKGRSASMLRKKFAWLGKAYWKEGVVWSLGYFVSTVVLNEQSIIRYVRWQGDQDSGQSSLDL
ncbi:MAG: IS200/IS605 family transposase [Chloroflexi bacterium]|nr:IS200/IS605 family transposase [Chloroflexota bacterium]